MAIINIESTEQFTHLSTSEANKLITIYFFATWASNSKETSEAFNAAANSSEEGLFLSIDADEQGDIAELFEIQSVPAFIFIKNGNILKEISSSDAKDFEIAYKQLTSNGSSLSPGKETFNSSNTEQPAPIEDDDEETEEQLIERLKQLTAAAPVMLFMKGTPSEPKCGFSRQMVGILREHQVRFGFFDILKDDTVRQGLKEFSDWPTFPQLYFNGELVGGLDIIKESLEEDPDFFAQSLSA
ncbi:hypothetical protein QEN19_001781 [Hanseniaspora menglaensis]